MRRPAKANAEPGQPNPSASVRRKTNTKAGPLSPCHLSDAITRTITILPEVVRQSLTWDQGAEMTEHLRLQIDAGLQVHFFDPHSPWQHGTNENTNGLL